MISLGKYCWARTVKYFVPQTREEKLKKLEEILKKLKEDSDDEEFEDAVDTRKSQQYINVKPEDFIRKSGNKNKFIQVFNY